MGGRRRPTLELLERERRGEERRRETGEKKECRLRHCGEPPCQPPLCDRGRLPHLPHST